MDDVRTGSELGEKSRESQAAAERVVGFAQRFSTAHLELACHAAFPLALTPDLVYRIWANFAPQAPWTAVADVLLSRLCREVGYELYEMDGVVRGILLDELVLDERFGQPRLDDLAEFLTDYVARHLHSDDEEERNLAQSQHWLALSYSRPDQVARELASVLAQSVAEEREAWAPGMGLEDDDRPEILRLASLVETFAEPLAEFQPLLIYARGLANYARDELEQAALDLDEVDGAQVGAVQLAIPDQVAPLMPGRIALAEQPVAVKETVEVEIEEVAEAAPEAFFNLVWVTGPYAGQWFPAPSQEMTIGRHGDNDLALLEDAYVSRRHAAIRVEGGKHILYDLGSTHGILVNQNRAAYHVLEPGDQVRLGTSQFVWTEVGETAPPVEAVEEVAEAPVEVPEAPFELICIQGPLAPQRVPIPSEGLTIGRHGDNDLVLEDTYASRFHAEIAVEGDQYVLYDRDSTHGTGVNGQQVHRNLLKPGDRIQISESEFTFVKAGAAVPQAERRDVSDAPAEPAAVLEGEFIEGYYEGYYLEDLTARGGVSVAYRARDPEGNSVVVRILRATDPYLVEKFMQEGSQIGPALRGHPNTVYYRQAGRASDDSSYIVLDYFDAPTLRQIMDQRQLGEAETVSILVQVANALAFAHQNGIIHRDVKPENIMVGADGSVKLVDFSIAKLLSDSTVTRDKIIGTPVYISPEQARGEPVVPASDLYSLGVVLYEMLTGSLPFQQPEESESYMGAIEVVRQHLAVQPEPVRKRNPQVSRKMEQVVMRALEKDPEKRFSSAEEMAQALEDAAPSTAAPSPEVGRTLAQYQIVAQLGQGGMSAVYRAHQPSLDRYVALKVLHPQLTADPEFLERFQRQARALAALSHPNIVALYDFGQDDGGFYIVMEYLEGHSLQAVIERESPMPLERVLGIVEQVGQALDYAHGRGVIHRDVKPSNIFVGEGDRTTLTDFGLAVAAWEARQTQSGVLVGTPMYMSPEQAEGGKVDHRTDLYSLGVVLYQMVVGRVPFRETMPLATLHAVINEEPPPPRQLNPGVTPALESVLLRALAKDPGLRYQTAGELVQALDGAILEELVQGLDDAFLGEEDGEYVLSLQMASWTDIGRVQPHNEDCTDFEVEDEPEGSVPRGDIYVVADGGGRQAGEVASEQAVEWAIDQYYADTTQDVAASLVRAVREANQQVYEAAQTDPTKSGMETTLVAAVLLDSKVYLANVGNSRAYVMNPTGITQITQDHTWVEEQVQAGRLTPEQTRQHPRRHQLTRSLGTGPDVQVDLFEGEIAAGDTLVLCTDGLTEHVQDSEIADIASEQEPEKAVQSLVDLANRRGGSDNITVLIISFYGEPPAPPEEKRRRGFLDFLRGRL